ncbi:MAG: hypothetical protein RXO24_00930, partial [Acidilobus sp.]
MRSESVRGAARRRALAVAVAAVALAALLIPLLAGRATSATPLAYVFNGSQGLRAAAVLSQPTYLPGKSVGLVNSVESTLWNAQPYFNNGQLIVNSSIAIIITNSQSIATQAPFDQFLNLTASQLGSVWNTLYSNHFLNMLFVNSSNEPLYAWVMNYTSSWVAVWVRLPNGIPADSSVVIYLEVTNKNEYPYTGIYSAVYKGYDNGNYTFTQYGYFNDTVPSWWKTGVYSGSFSPTPTTSGLEMTNNAGNEGTYAYAPIPNLNGNYTVVVSWWYNGNADALQQELYGNVSNLTHVDYVYETTDGGNTPYAYGGIADQNEFYSNDKKAYIRDPYGLVSEPFLGSGTYYVVTDFAVVNGTTEYWGYTTVASPFQLEMPSSLYEISLKVDREEAYVFIGAGTGGSAAYIYLDTVLVFPTPPNNVMPSYTVVNGQYLAWRYTPTSNTVNITLHVTSYPINTANTVGVALYSSNIGNLQTDGSGSFYGLLISFNGSVLYHAPGSSYTSLKSSAFPTPKAPFTMTVLLTQSSGNVTVSYVYINGTAYAVNLVTPMPWTDIGYVGLRASPGNSLYVSYFGVSPSPFGGVEDFINSVESTSGWSTLPYLANGQLVFSSPGTGDYIAWVYVPISNTLNVTIRLSKATVPSGTNSSIFLASSGLGNTGSIYSSSGYYYLGVSLFDNSSSNGIITFK